MCNWYENGCCIFIIFSAFFEISLLIVSLKYVFTFKVYWCRLFVDSLIQLTSSWLYSYEEYWQCFITRSCLSLRSLSRLWEQSSYDIKYDWYQSVSRMYSDCKWWFQMRYWKLMYEFSNLNHHENKIKVLLKYILFFWTWEK